MPATRPAVPPKDKICELPDATAGRLSTTVVPFWMPMIVAPLGIPAPFTPRPSESKLVLATVTTLEPLVVVAPEIEIWALVVMRFEAKE